MRSSMLLITLVAGLAKRMNEFINEKSGKQELAE